MAMRWLKSATQLWEQRKAAETPQPFELDCACGHRVSGIRRANYQTAACHRCGTILFVLPSDVYPKPKPKPASKPASHSPSFSGRETVLPAETVETVRGSVRTAKTAGAAQKMAVSIAATAPAPAPAPTALLREEIETPVTAVLRRVLVNRLVLVAISMLAIVCATGYFVWQSRMKEDARVSLPAHLESGAAALRAGNVSDAAADYQQAARDVDRLGRHDAEALAIRQKARELNAVVNLSPVPLYEICEQLRSVPAADRQKWGEKLGELYRHTWFVVEGDVVEETGPDGRGQPLIRFPFPIDSAPAPVVFDARLTALSTPTGEAGSRHVIFAGQLASLTREGSKNHPPLWVLRLNDATAFLWAGIDTYQALGVVPENPRAAEETRRLLNQQAASLGIKP